MCYSKATLCWLIVSLSPLFTQAQDWTDGFEPDGDGLVSSDTYGTIYAANAPWYFFFEWSAWLYGEASPASKLWLYKPFPPEGWYWGGSYPYVYYAVDQDWLYVHEGYVYNFTDGAWRQTDAPARVVVRKEIMQLTDQEVEAFVQTLLAMKNTPSAYDSSVNAYDYFVRLHMLAFMCGSEISCPHGSSLFLPWHREMLRRFELELQRVSGDPSMALPYWDWSNLDSFDRIFSAEFLGDSGSNDPDEEFVVQASPFGEVAGLWRKAFTDFTDDEFDGTTGDTATPDEVFLTRGFNLTQFYRLPTEADVEYAYGFSLYDPAGCKFEEQPDSFRAYLESGSRERDVYMHDGVHVYVGGDMATATSPNDPVFFLHHCNVDRIWAVWQEIHGQDKFPEACVDEVFYGFGESTAREQFDHRKMGFRYTDPKD